MPTGVALGDARGRLFDAAERILLRDGPSGLTSRSVTTEAGCAKGVLHRHFTDFEGFLAELILDRVARVEARGAALREQAGTGTVAGNLADALSDMFGPVAVAGLGLVTFHDGLRARLREHRPGGLPILTDAAIATTVYLADERERGRIVASADVETLAPTLIGTASMLFADRTGERPEADTVRATVATVIAGALPS